jgi:hypothetical protein
VRRREGDEALGFFFVDLLVDAFAQSVSARKNRAYVDHYSVSRVNSDHRENLRFVERSF